jgi:REP element-mobilizing transposase RayT
MDPNFNDGSKTRYSSRGWYILHYFTCYKWLNLIDITNGYDLIYKWFDYLKQQAHFIIGYQIMPNHIHTIIGFRNIGKNINKIIGSGKRFIAYEIIKRKANRNERFVAATGTET